jgi:MFS family permease
MAVGEQARERLSLSAPGSNGGTPDRRGGERDPGRERHWAAGEPSDGQAQPWSPFLARLGDGVGLDASARAVQGPSKIGVPGLYTNKAPGGVANACSIRITEAVYLVERMVDILADELGIDPAALRKTSGGCAMSESSRRSEHIAAGPEDHVGEAARGRALLGRMDRLPGWPLPRFDLFVLGLAYFFVFYDITDIGFGLPAIVKQFHLSANDVKFVAIAIGLVGYIVGSNLIAAFAHRRGRRPAFLVSLLVSGVGSLGSAFATGVVSLSIWRFLTGMGVGAALNLATTYVGELAPSSQRGRISVRMFMIGIMGQAITPFVALALVPNFHIGWRLLFAIGALIGLAGVLFALRLPESPRWLIQHSRLKEAEDMEQYPLLLHFPYVDLYRKQVVKQADLVLALLLRGDAFTAEEKVRNFAYYEALTVRDSSLSACTQAVIAAEVGRLELAYDYFAEAALMDLDNLEHNTRDGLHIASLAGAWIVAVAGFGGMRDHDGALRFAPRLPERLTRLAFASASATGGYGSRSPTRRPATRSWRDRRSRSPTTARRSPSPTQIQ